MNKKLILSLVLGIFLIGIISAQVSYCCERTTSGAWCQNAPEDECNAGYRVAPTSCEATSYCKLGVCINSEEGTCMPNTPERICTEAGGIWDEREKEDIPQCQLGCCLIGEEAAFTTLTRCKSLASTYGLEMNYRTDIQSETECIANARPKVKGACVFEREYERTCKLLEKRECLEMQSEESNVEFYEGYLCSANSLTTNCGPRGGTTCVEGKDEVYSTDTCGNIVNIYDSEKWNDNDEEGYWGRIMAPDCIFEEDGNSCGNCDYLLGSTCKRGNANYGNYVCKDLGCDDNDFEEEYGRNPEHRETWCSRVVDGETSLGTNPGVIGEEIGDLENVNFPGSRDFRLVCYDGEVSVEPCADYRQEICVESEVSTSKTATCKVNMWQDCYSQDNEKDCNNTAQRDCVWIKGVSILRDEEGNSLITDLDEEGDPIEASCIPMYTPGFNFWEEGTDAEGICSLASTACYVQYSSTIGKGALKGERGDATGDWRCIEKCRAEAEECFLNLDDPLGICKFTCENKCGKPECVEEDGEYNTDWIEKMNTLSIILGDCGSSDNYLEESGYYEDASEFVARSGEEEE